MSFEYASSGRDFSGSGMNVGNGGELLCGRRLASETLT